MKMGRSRFFSNQRSPNLSSCLEVVVRTGGLPSSASGADLPASLPHIESTGDGVNAAVAPRNSCLIGRIGKRLPVEGYWLLWCDAWPDHKGPSAIMMARRQQGRGDTVANAVVGSIEVSFGSKPREAW